MAKSPASMLKRHFSVKSIGIKKQKELFFFCFFYFPASLFLLISLSIIPLSLLIFFRLTISYTLMKLPTYGKNFPP